MAVIQPHLNPSTSQPYTTSEYCRAIVDIYQLAVEEQQANPNKPWVSPIGGVCDKEVLDYCNMVNAITNPYEREQVALNALSNKEFLRTANINKSLIDRK